MKTRQGREMEDMKDNRPESHPIGYATEGIKKDQTITVIIHDDKAHCDSIVFTELGIYLLFEKIKRKS